MKIHSFSFSGGVLHIDVRGDSLTPADAVVAVARVSAMLDSATGGDTRVVTTQVHTTVTSAVAATEEAPPAAEPAVTEAPAAEAQAVEAPAKRKRAAKVAEPVAEPVSNAPPEPAPDLSDLTPPAQNTAPVAAAVVDAPPVTHQDVEAARLAAAKSRVLAAIKTVVDKAVAQGANWDQVCEAAGQCNATMAANIQLSKDEGIAYIAKLCPQLVPGATPAAAPASAAVVDDLSDLVVTAPPVTTLPMSQAKPAPVTMPPPAQPKAVPPASAQAAPVELTDAHVEKFEKMLDHIRGELVTAAAGGAVSAVKPVHIGRAMPKFGLSTPEVEVVLTELEDVYKAQLPSVYQASVTVRRAVFASASSAPAAG